MVFRALTCRFVSADYLSDWISLSFHQFSVYAVFGGCMWSNSVLWIDSPTGYGTVPGSQALVSHSTRCPVPVSSIVVVSLLHNRHAGRIILTIESLISSILRCICFSHSRSFGRVLQWLMLVAIYSPLRIALYQPF